MDALAKRHMSRTERRPQASIQVSKHQWVVKLHDQLPHRFHVREVYEILYEPMIRAY